MALDFVATYKVLVLGDSNVGKTCIVHRYCDEKYYDTYISTIGNLLVMVEDIQIFRNLNFRELVLIDKIIHILYTYIHSALLGLCAKERAIRKTR